MSTVAASRHDLRLRLRLHLLLLLELPRTLLSLLQVLHIILLHQNLRIHLLSLPFVTQLVPMLESSLGSGGSSSHPLLLLKAMMRMMMSSLLLPLALKLSPSRFVMLWLVLMLRSGWKRCF